MSADSENVATTLRAKWLLPLVGVLLVGHFVLATSNWQAGFMIGHEFRQAQTALITKYIDQDNNFSPYYETPILGKPWAFPLELPVYQWCVVGVKRWLEIEDFKAARGVSLASFYLTLPALYLLLGSFRVPPLSRLLILTPLLACPIYLFYSRSFLIDPMTSMLSAWFLASFVRTMQKRKWWWVVVATSAGTLAILIKSLVFAVWLFPAAVFGAWVLFQDIRERRTLKQIAATLGWGLSPVVLPYLAFRDWILFTDALKGSHPAAFEFTSVELSKGNFGTFSLSSRINPETWQILAQRWSETVGSGWFIGATLGVGLCVAPHRWRAILGLTGLWLFGQLAFPFAYAFQDYYFYAGTFFLMMAFGVVLLGLVESNWMPRVLAAGLACLPLGVMLHGYWQGYGVMQRVQSHGGSGLTAMLRDMLPKGSVIMGLGFDWSAIIPYYSGHRALMVRDAQRYDLDYLKRAIKDLKSELVVALLVSEEMATKGSKIVEEVVDELQLVSVPMLRQVEAGVVVDVYISPYFYEEIVRRMGPGGGSRYPHVELLLKALPEGGLLLGPTELMPSTSKVAFPMINEPVTRFDIAYGYRRYPLGGNKTAINFHPDASLWIAPEQRSGTIRWCFGLFNDSWNREGDHTDGVKFRVEAEAVDGTRREIFSRVLDPKHIADDRGLVEETFAYELKRDETLRFSSGGVSSHAYDWAYIERIEFGQ